MKITLTERFQITNVPNYIAPPLAPDIYDELMKGDSADKMLESVTIDEVDHNYLGDEIIHVSQNAMFEAITSERIRLSQTMRAFIRSLNRGMNGTGLTAGTNDADVDDAGSNTIGGAIIGKVRRVNNIPLMTAQIPLSDGQSISLIFHSPTAESGRIKNNDMLVAFRFLLNKRDVTHIVAPIGGKDVSLQQVSQALANLVERNSAKFTKQKSAQVKLRADIDGLNAETDQLSDQQSELLEQVEAKQIDLLARQGDNQTLRNKISQQRQINAELEAQLASLKVKGSDVTLPGETGRVFTDTTRQVKQNLSLDGKSSLSNGAVISYKVADFNGELSGWVEITDTSGKVFKMQSPSSQGAKMGETATKLLKAYRDNKADKFIVSASENADKPDVPETATAAPGEESTSEGKYRYALVNRPAGVGAIPPGNTAILPPLSSGEPYARVARHGFVVYESPLSEADASAFELKLIPTHADLDALATKIAQGRMNSYAAEYLDMANNDADTFRSQVSIFARKEAPNLAFPEGGDLTYFLQAMKDALSEAAKNPPQKDIVEQPQPQESANETDAAEEVLEVDKAANDALAYLQSVISLQSKDMGVIRESRGKVRGAIAALQSAGRDVENEPLVNEAAQHLSDLLVAIQREGATA